MAIRHYQSYQSGIETLVVVQAGAPVVLPIVPIWNWNGIRGSFFQESETPTNRTNLELKLAGIALIALGTAYQSYQSGIETGIGIFTQKLQSSLPIVPIWNWNTKVKSEMTWPNVYQSYQSGIETLSELQKTQKAWATNRTNLELKHALKSSTTLRKFPTNRTNLELKLQNQYGLFTSTIPTNRTNLELKLAIKAIQELTDNYQSYQSGIET